jgi:hypothetical protein
MCDRPYTSTDKWNVSIMAGLMFMLFSSPYSFSLTNKVTSGFGLEIANGNGVPNLAGVLLHGGAFVGLSRFLMEMKNSQCMKPYTSKDKWIVALVGGLLFILMSSPFLYETINTFTSTLGAHTLDNKDTPTIQGMILHSILFTLATRLLMR